MLYLILKKKIIFHIFKRVFTAQKGNDWTRANIFFFVSKFISKIRLTNECHKQNVKDQRKSNLSCFLGHPVHEV